ncbi:hypothetical protein M2262_003225 [Pseudomonas sp. BIGb0408]|uniref:Uncharacterized protein n=1 Tax=Phytopseudomonas flavescens TaxID=29435 RepID=A0A7Y9XLE1_9GAMM|nr:MULTISPECIES: hypothetical protein [Pseudomonas]MCW2293175.1 hypothetical protein [Pseudomonas sp. BIGb0408]NYH72254.1 hypothetical protein [Pseudomonas flavescens]
MNGCLGPSGFHPHGYGLAGLRAPLYLALSRHQLLHRRYFVRYAPEIERHRALADNERLMVAADLADTDQFGLLSRNAADSRKSSAFWSMVRVSIEGSLY